MQIRIITFLILLMSGFHSFGQTISRSVQAVAGGDATIGDIKLSWTMGEANVNMLHSSSLIITEGFQQPIIEINKGMVEWNKDSWEFNLFPNPTQAIIHLKITDAPNQQEDLEAEVINMSGKKIMRHIPIQLFGDNTIDVQALPAGNYFLKIQRQDQLPIRSFPFIKTK